MSELHQIDMHRDVKRLIVIVEYETLYYVIRKRDVCAITLRALVI